MLVTAKINSLKYFNQSYQCHQYTRLSKNAHNTVELNLSGLIGTASHQNMQKIQIIGFFF